MLTPGAQYHVSNTCHRWTLVRRDGIVTMVTSRSPLRTWAFLGVATFDG